MWVQTLSDWVIMVALVAQTGGPALTKPAQPSLPQLVPMRQATFAIPYRIDRPDDRTHQPVEVQLFVSVDRGVRWQFYAKAPLTQPNFPFRAGGDGEFWFAIRTVDRSGQARPATIPGPGLRVLVDTKPPVIRLAAQSRPDGQVIVRFELDEQNPKPTGPTIVYRSAATEPWQPVPIDQQTLNTTPGHQTGEALFWPKMGTTDLLIRADAADVASNVASAQTRLQLAPASQQRQAMNPAAGLEKSAGVDNSRLTVADKPAANFGPGETKDSKGSVSIAINPAIGNRYAGDDRGTTGRPGPRGATFPGLPPGERPRWVNSRLFELEYDVDSVGPSGIGRVELWGTQDGGKTWRNYPVGNSRRSPLLVNVDAEGVYGFRVVVANGAGLGARPPRSGDLPDLWIGVDLTKPAARIVSAQQGADSEAGHLIISWQADDRMLAARPISLSFSESRSGPWLPIGSGLENTGRYAWPIDNRIPPKVFLRIEVRDEAGNMAVHELADPIPIDQSRPTIRIRDVRPLGDSGARSTLWR
ncbi:MAG: hypothetical protein ABFC63_08080 [Thermoguttaceae bacterium]